MLSETIVLNKERNVTLTTFIQPVEGEFRYIKKRPAILVIPGGGYQMCSDREAEVIAIEYLRAGYQAFVLRYSIKKDAVWPNPLNDYDQAMELIRSKAEEWYIYKDKIAVVGFSAGGHLASAAATMAENRPNAAILGYAVTTEETAHMCSLTAPSTWDKVDGNTCPCFIFSTRTDNVVPITNSIQFMDALDKAGIAFESHIYSYGPHGFSTGNSSVQAPDTVICNRASKWVSDSIEWLKDILGDFSADGGMTKPRCMKKLYADDEEFLSIDCRMRYLMQHAEAQQILAPLLQGIKEKTEALTKQSGMADEDKGMDISVMMSNMTLRDALGFASLPKEMLEQIDQQLRQIPNK
ncbi:MAG: esterase/lipase-like protein [Herbinix sp.]|nr:esterase/lipase-like protein [Herbinix sp.]